MSDALGILFFGDTSGVAQEKRFTSIARRVWGISFASIMIWTAIVLRKADAVQILIPVLVLCEYGLIASAATTNFQLWDSTVYSLGVLGYVLAQAIATSISLAWYVTGYHVSIRFVFVAAVVGAVGYAIWDSRITSPLMASLFICISTSGMLFPPRMNYVIYAFVPSFIGILYYEKRARRLIAIRSMLMLTLIAAPWGGSSER